MISLKFIEQNDKSNKFVHAIEKNLLRVVWSVCCVIPLIKLIFQFVDVVLTLTVNVKCLCSCDLSCPH